MWASSADGSSNWGDIVGATSESYTPVAADLGSYLRAIVSYDDGEGTGKSAEAVSDNAMHRAPTFSEGGSVTRTVAEHTLGGGNVGDPVTATDQGGDTLAYSITGTDANLFSVDVYTGQLRVGESTTLDFEAPGSADNNNDYQVTMSASEIAPYDRDNWRHWTDADGDCQNARHEVLVAESLVAVTFKTNNECQVVTGEWVGAFTGTTVTDPSSLDIDHFVPLANAWKSGAWAWDEDKKEEYANYLDDPHHLIAVTASANRSKGAWGPERTGNPLWSPSIAITPLGGPISSPGGS